MPTISVTSNSKQNLVLDGITFPANAVTNVDVFAWVKIRNTYNPDHLSADESEITRQISLYKDDCFTRFELQGEASLKASITRNGISSPAELSFAHEWLEEKYIEREARRDARDDEAISIARSASFAATAAAAAASEANAISRSNRRISIVSAIAALIAAAAAIKWS